MDFHYFKICMINGTEIPLDLQIDNVPDVYKYLIENCSYDDYYILSKNLMIKSNHIVIIKMMY